MTNISDTIFVMINAMLVLFMTFALEMVFAGSTRAKHTTQIMTRLWISYGVTIVLWFCVGFSLTIGTDSLGIIGNFDYFLLNNIGLTPIHELGTFFPPLMLFVLLTLFAVFSATLAIGPEAERLNLKAYTLFIILWNLLVYIPLSHMVWGRGILSQIGLIDGGTGITLHICIGASALATAKFFKKTPRTNYTPLRPELISIGCSILMVGWITINGCSGLLTNNNYIGTTVNSIIGSASGMVIYVIFTAAKKQKIDFSTVILGSFAGLIGTASSATYVTPQSAFLIGSIVAFVCNMFIQTKDCKELSNNMTIIWILHGIGGISSIILAGIFVGSEFYTCNYTVGRQLITQMGCAYAAAIGSYIWTWIIFTVIGKLVPLSPPEDLEYEIGEKILQERKKMFWGDKPVSK